MNIVISGANSYIGNSIQSYIAAVDGSITVSQLDVSKEEWNSFDFGGVDGFAFAISKLMSDQTLCNAMAINNVNLSNKYGVETIVSTMKNIYD